jgi:hypothetical protein
VAGTGGLWTLEDADLSRLLALCISTRTRRASSSIYISAKTYGAINLMFHMLLYKKRRSHDASSPEAEETNPEYKRLTYIP